MTHVRVPWTCPKCEAENLDWLPMKPPGVACLKCGYVYYLGKMLDEAIDRETENLGGEFGVFQEECQPGYIDPTGTEGNPLG